MNNDTTTSPVRTRPLTAVRNTLRLLAQPADHRTVAREIASYPATRSAAVVVLPTARRAA
jgi:hypothetical protein